MGPTRWGKQTLWRAFISHRLLAALRVLAQHAPLANTHADVGCTSSHPRKGFQRG